MTYRWVLFGMLALLSSCGTPETTSSATTTPDATLPPGFLDPAPPGPTSSSYVLSGGTLVWGDEVIPDCVVVITDGRLVSWGIRGGTEVPNDSIGHDLRGKWILPGTPDKLSHQLVAGEPAALVIVDQDPSGVTSPLAHISGVVADGVLELN